MKCATVPDIFRVSRKSVAMKIFKQLSLEEINELFVDQALLYKG